MAKETKKVKKIEKKTVKTEKTEIVKKLAKQVKPIKLASKVIAKQEKTEKVPAEDPKGSPRDVGKKPKRTNKKAQKDTGSTDFQIKNFTQKIQSLSDHLKIHGHDFDSRRGLLIMVGKRRRLLNYLKKSEPEKYAKAVADLKLTR